MIEVWLSSRKRSTISAAECGCPESSLMHIYERIDDYPHTAHILVCVWELYGKMEELEMQTGKKWSRNRKWNDMTWHGTECTQCCIHYHRKWDAHQMELLLQAKSTISQCKKFWPHWSMLMSIQSKEDGSALIDFNWSAGE